MATRLPIIESAKQGFTLIELIVVILVISLLAVSALVRFSDNTGFAEYTYQARLITALRNIQNRAMFDTRQNYCFQMNFDASAPAFGPPSLSYANGDASDTCQSNIDYNNPNYLTTTSTEMSADDISLTTQGDSATSFNYLRFDNHGRPSTDNTTCTGSCIITLSGEATLKVCVESEGYIHACE